MLAASDDAELVAIWGRDPVARPRRPPGASGIAGFTDLDRLLAEVDAVAIAVPRRPGRAGRVAAAAGRHLLLDKPLALSLDGADRGGRGGGGRRGRLADLFTLRFLPPSWPPGSEAAGAVGSGRAAKELWLGSAVHRASTALRRVALAADKGAL